MSNKVYNYNSQFVKELSQISHNIEKDYTVFKDFPVRFYDGDFIETAISLCKDLLPTAKVVVFSTPSSFSKFGEELNVRLKGQRNQTVNFIIDENQEVNLSFIKNIINFPEDVRGVVVTDTKLVRLAEYVCSIRNIVLILRVDKFLDDGIVKNRIHVKNGEITDYVKVSLSRHVIIDLEELSKDENRASCYAQIMGRTVSLLDYRIKTCFKDFTPDVFAYGLVKKTILDVFNIFKYSYFKQSEVLICGLLKIEMANLLTNGEIDDFSAINGFNYLYGNFQATIDAVDVLLGLYELGYSENYDKILSIVDYNQINEELKAKSYSGETELLKWLINRSKIFSKSKKDLSTISNLLIPEIQGLKSSFEKMEKTYLVLGGKKLLESDRNSSNFVFAIKHCGNLPFGFNGISLLSEKGVTEFLK